jgi:hypothetical protein
VLGADDGIVSTASLMIGVAACSWSIPMPTSAMIAGSASTITAARWRHETAGRRGCNSSRLPTLIPTPQGELVPTSM